MILLYRPVLIETAEQAEALPIGTLAISSEDYDDGTVMHWAAVKVSNVWARTDVGDGLPIIFDATMVDADSPWTALVPIEAEEEITSGPSSCECDLSAGPTALHLVDKHPDPPAAHRRLVTPRETVEEPVEGEARADCGDGA